MALVSWALCRIFPYVILDNWWLLRKGCSRCLWKTSGPRWYLLGWIFRLVASSDEEFLMKASWLKFSVMKLQRLSEWIGPSVTEVGSASQKNLTSCVWVRRPFGRIFHNIQTLFSLMVVWMKMTKNFIGARLLKTSSSRTPFTWGVETFKS